MTAQFPAVPQWFDNLAWPFQQSLGWFYFEDDPRYAQTGVPEPQRPWLVVLMLPILPIMILHFLVTAICYAAVMNKRDKAAHAAQKTSLVGIKEEAQQIDETNTGMPTLDVLVSDRVASTPLLQLVSSSSGDSSPPVGKAHVTPPPLVLTSAVKAGNSTVRLSSPAKPSFSSPEPFIADAPLRVSAFEWWVANEYAEDLERAGYMISGASLPKLSRKDEAYWERMATEYIKRFASADVANMPEAAVKTVLLRGKFSLSKTPSEQFNLSDPLAVHSFEFLIENGEVVPYATAVHSFLGVGGYSKVKRMENKAGDVKIKKVALLSHPNANTYGPPSETPHAGDPKKGGNAPKKPRTLALEEVNKNFMVLHTLGMANALRLRPKHYGGMGRGKAVLIGRKMDNTLDGYLKSIVEEGVRTGVEHHFVRALNENPIDLFFMMLPVIHQVSELHDPNISPAPGKLPKGRYLHLDIKAKNILVKSNSAGALELVLIDFDGLKTVPAGKEDFQRQRDRGFPGHITTREYRPPELCAGAGGDRAQAKMGTYTDIYALGKTCIKLKGLLRMPSTAAPNQQAVLNALIRWMLCENYQKRPSAQELLAVSRELEVIMNEPVKANRDRELNRIADEIQVKLSPSVKLHSGYRVK